MNVKCTWLVPRIHSSNYPPCYYPFPWEGRKTVNTYLKHFSHEMGTGIPPQKTAYCFQISYLHALGHSPQRRKKRLCVLNRPNITQSALLLASEHHAPEPELAQWRMWRHSSMTSQIKSPVSDWLPAAAGKADTTRVIEFGNMHPGEG